MKGSKGKNAAEGGEKLRTLDEETQKKLDAWET